MDAATAESHRMVQLGVTIAIMVAIVGLVVSLAVTLTMGTGIVGIIVTSMFGLCVLAMFMYLYYYVHYQHRRPANRRPNSAAVTQAVTQQPPYASTTDAGAVARPASANAARATRAAAASRPMRMNADMSNKSPPKPPPPPNANSAAGSGSTTNADAAATAEAEAKAVAEAKAEAAATAAAATRAEAARATAAATASSAAAAAAAASTVHVIDPTGAAISSPFREIWDSIFNPQVGTQGIDNVVDGTIRLVNQLEISEAVGYITNINMLLYQIDTQTAESSDATKQIIAQVRDTLLKKIESCELKRSRWTENAHVRLAKANANKLNELMYAYTQATPKELAEKLKTIADILDKIDENNYKPPSWAVIKQIYMKCFATMELHFTGLGLGNTRATEPLRLIRAARKKVNAWTA